VLPEYEPEWTVERGVQELYQAFVDEDLSLDDLTGPRYSRIAHIKGMLEDGALRPDLRWAPDRAPLQEAERA
jgi:hypothetical protein